MTRPINPSTGKPYERRLPIDWDAVLRILKFRQAEKRILDAGFKKVRAFSALEWCSPDCSHRIVDTAIYPDGTVLYVKLEPRK